MACNSYASPKDSIGLNVFFKNLKELNFKKTKRIIGDVKNIGLKNKLKVLYRIIYDNGQSSLKELNINIEEKPKNDTEKVLVNLIIGYKLAWYKNNRINSYNYFINAYEKSLKLKCKPLINFSLRSILALYRKGIVQNNLDYKFYLKEFRKNIRDRSDSLIFYSYKFNLIAQTEIYNPKESKYQKTYNNLLVIYDSLVKKINKSNNLLVYYYKDRGNILIRVNPREAEKCYKKQLFYSKDLKFYNPIKFNALCNLSRVCSLKEEYLESINYINKAKKFINVNENLKNKFAISAYKAEYFAKLKQYDSAFFHIKKSNNFIIKLNIQKDNTEISKIRQKLETEKKEKENIRLKAERQETRNLLIASFTTLILVATIAILTLKNSRKKRQLAEQQKRLEQQKNITLLKEQEINAINAMVEGQEKERKQIAEDLHDNIGSVLATLKLHFENLKLNRKKKHFNQEELYDKTEKLIDETYFKIRSIAHAKNSGVIANQGLLNAVKMMAEKISSANKTQIEVIDFGLNTKLDDALEISTFRIIQELTTNIIKHSEAQNATINISQFKDNLNIIIEDNGKGFNTDKINLKNGMGLSSITTRIEYLKGTINIDSSIGNGTSVIINLPLVNA